MVAALAHESDLDLLRRFGDGDEDAFAEIVRRYAGLVYSVCKRVLRERAWAEDVSQETFYRLVQSRERVTQSLGGWLHRAATRLSLDALRSENARTRREQIVAAERAVEAAAAEEARAGGVRWGEISPIIDEALAELPDEPRDLLVRHFLQGVSQADLAAEYDTSAPTLSRRMRNAINLLRNGLERRGMTLMPSAVLPVLALVASRTEAASAALTTELGKMAMISGTGDATLGFMGAGESATSSMTGAHASTAASHLGPLWKISLLATVALSVVIAIPAMWFLMGGDGEPTGERGQDVPSMLDPLASDSETPLGTAQPAGGRIPQAGR